MTSRSRVQTGERSAGPVEPRLLALASLLETLPDIRAAVDDTSADILSLIDQLQRLAEYLRQRHDSTQWDAADYLATRITLQALAALAVHLQRSVVQTREHLTGGRQQLREAAREIARLKASLAEPASAADA